MDERAHDGERTVSGTGCGTEPVLHSLEPAPEVETSESWAEPAVPREPLLLPRAAGGGAGAVAAFVMLAPEPGRIEAVPVADPDPQPVAPEHAAAPEDPVFCEAGAAMEPAEPLRHVEPALPTEPARALPPLLELIPEVLPTPGKLPALSPSVAPVLRSLQLERVLHRQLEAPAIVSIAPPPEPHPPPPSERPPPPPPSLAVALPADAVHAPSPHPSPAVPLPIPSGELPSIGRRPLRLVLQLALTLLIAIAALMLALLVLYRWVDPPTSTLMLGQRLAGTPISQRWVALDRMSPNLHHAAILSEDARFCRHRGVDWGELKEAIESAGDGMARGGSTISMQVVKNLFLWPSRSYLRKALEIPLAYAIEALWPKRRILEIYLNIAEWGPGVFGAEAAARYHFRKSALLLTPREAALLAVSLPNPFERQAGRPGPGTLRLADNLLLRMKAAQANAACVRARPDKRG